MRYLSVDEVLELHRRVIRQSRGTDWIRDRAGLESSVDDQERIMLDVADGKLSREDFTEWVRRRIMRLP